MRTLKDLPDWVITIGTEKSRSLYRKEDLKQMVVEWVKEYKEDGENQIAYAIIQLFDISEEDLKDD